MQMKAETSLRGPDDSTKRLSISLSSKEKAALERVAADKRVSLAWVVRDAISQYLKSQKIR